MTTVSKNVRTEFIINEQFDFAEHSLTDAAISVESELTGLDVAEFHNTLRLQHLVLQSQLSDFDLVDKSKLLKLIDCLYQQQDFKGDWKAFFKVENALISNVLSRRKGIPISLGVLLLDFLKESQFDAQGICFPSGFIVRVNIDDETIYIDPFTGELASRNLLELKLRGQLGNHARLSAEMLEPDDNKTIMMRLINVIKAAYVQEKSLEQALLCCDMLLRIDPNDAYEVRDRGFLFQQLDCLNLARTDFEFFIEHYPQDPIVGLLKRQIRQINIDTPTQVVH
ncbi:MAG: regulator of sirC expression with transglutaminase-like and TPR domain [Psychromonas sp.]|jgi:regulator of sirC expression with transglutaminase-like and TPR domain